MSAEDPTEPKNDIPKVCVDDVWRGTEARAGVAPKARVESVTPGDESEGAEERKRKSDPSRRVRFILPIAVVIFAVALAWIVVPALVGDGPTRHSKSTLGARLAKPRRADERGPSRTRWAKEPDASPRSRQGRSALEASQGRRRTHPRRGPAPAESDSPSRPSASAAAPPEPSAPAPPPASEPKGSPGLRDGATESTEFGL